MSLPFYKSTSKTWLQGFFWEVKSRFFYLCIALGSSLIISYINSESLLYLFLLSADRKSKILESSNWILEMKDFPKIISENNTVFGKTEQSCVTKFSKSEKLTFYPPHSGGDTTSFCTPVSDLCPPSGVSFARSFPDLSTDLKERLNNDLLKRFLEIPDHSISFIFTDVEEAFASHLLICFLFSMIVIFPYLIYVLLSFFSPSLFWHQCKKSIIDSIKFFVFWCFFTITLQKTIIPKIGEYLISFNIENKGFHIEASTKIYSYCVWALEIYMIFSCFFIVVYLIIYLSLNRSIKIDFFIEKQKWLRLVLLLVSTFLAPPDLGSTIAISLISLFSLEICFYFLFIYDRLLNK